MQNSSKDKSLLSIIRFLLLVPGIPSHWWPSSLACFANEPATDNDYDTSVVPSVSLAPEGLPFMILMRGFPVRLRPQAMMKDLTLEFPTGLQLLLA
jgi:hypothetical protein